jgi:hypothetical protein
MAVLFTFPYTTRDFVDVKAVARGANIVVTKAAALGSGDYGLQVSLDTSTSNIIQGYNEKSVTVATGEIRARIFIDPNTLAMATNDVFVICDVLGNSGDVIGNIKLQYSGASYQITSSVREDDLSWTTVQTDNISDASHNVEFHIEQATGVIASDGRMRTWIDGVLQGTAAGLDNWDIFDVDSVRWGAIEGVDSGTSGVFFIGDIVANDDGGEIGTTTTTTVTTTTVTTTVTTTTVTTTTSTTTAAPVCDVTVAVTQVACSGSTGNQDITTADLGGDTPVAAFFMVTYCEVNGTEVVDAVFGMGAATGSSNRWAMCVGDRNGQDPTDSNRRGATDECVMVIYPGNGAINGEADFVSFITNGVRINWGAATDDNYLLTVVLFAGTDVSAQADVFAMPAASGNTIDVNTVGFEPDLLLTACFGATFIDSATLGYHHSHGLVLNKVADEQYSWTYRSETAAATSAIAGQISTSYGIGQVGGTGAYTWAGEFGSFDANGFSCTTRVGGSASDEVGFLALAFDGAVDFEGGIIDTPVAGGNQSIADPAFTPQYVHVGMTYFQSIDSADATADAGSYGVSSFDDDDEYSNSAQIEDNSPASDTQSMTDDQCVNLPQDDGSTGFTATFVSFDANGWTWNFGDTLGTARKWWYLAIEECAAATTTSTTTTLTTSTTTTLTTTTTVTLAITRRIVVPTHWQSQAISISVFEPTISSYTPAGTYIESFIDAEGLNFTIQAMGGYWDCRFNVSDRLERLNAWLDNGVGRHIEVYSPELVKIWEGFVNKVTLNVGGFTVVRGPLMDIANDVMLVYSTVDTSVSPPLTGVRAKSAAVTNTDSQAQFGIIEKVLSAGGVPVAQVADILNTYITENSLPETSKSLTAGGANAPSVSVECFGYVHWLRLYAYNQTANTGEIDLSTKMENILTADPNTLFSTDYSGVEDNTLQVKRWENNDRTAWALIRSLVAKGDTFGNRYTFGIYNDRRAVYEQIPDDFDYQQRLADPSQRFETPSGLEVKPWNLTAARWLLFPDFLIGRTQPATVLREDPRALFIESLTYTAPWSVSINGGKVETLNQKLAQLGLAGIGAN